MYWFIVCLIGISQSIIINTKYGSIEGLTNDGVNTFIGIPFAKPPIGNLRFAPPEHPDPFKISPYDATIQLDDVVQCPQNGDSTTGSHSENEDCLYLNIFAPSKRSRRRQRYTVMIWIHGGSFQAGSGSFFAYNATNFVRNNNVIVVTFNYRLGILGFLYDNQFNTGINGNFGYLDQKLAIKWVQENIKEFGGNCKEIVLFGQSAGSQSIATHLLYNNNGIKRAIMQSPSLNIPYRDPVTWYDVPRAFSNSVNCDMTDILPAELVKCWRSVNISTIVASQSNPAIANNWRWAEGILFTPTALTPEIPNQPFYELQNNKKIPPFIIGTNRDEQFLFFDDGVPFTFSYDFLLYSLALFIDGVDILINPDPALIINSLRILSYYNISGSNSLTGDYYKDSFELLSDIWYCSIRNILNNIKRTKDIYYYNFDVIDANFTQLILKDDPECNSRTCHAEEIYYLFQPPLIQSLFDDHSKEIGCQLQRFWTNYAKTGNPNNIKHSKLSSSDSGHRGRGVDNKKANTLWPEYRNKNKQNKDRDNFLRISGFDEYIKQSTFTDETRANTNKISSRNNLCDFWDEIGYLYGSESAASNVGTASTANNAVTNEENPLEQSYQETELIDDNRVNFVYAGIIAAVFMIICIVLGLCCYRYKTFNKAQANESECDDY